MKIVIAQGHQSADYLIKMFKSNKKHEIIIINNDLNSANYISQENGIDVELGDPTKEFILEKANIYNANLFIALSTNDADNYVACMLAKKSFNIQKCICRVVNPKNVEIFKKLGIDIVISSTYLLGETIKSMISVSNLVKTLSIEDEKIVLSEVILKENDYACNKSLKDLNIPNYASISCIFRNPNVIIPKGNTILLKDDKILVISNPKAQKKVLEFLEHGNI